MHFRRRYDCALMLLATLATACEGPQGPAGSVGPPGPEGPPASPTPEDGGVPSVPIMAGPGLVLDISGAQIQGNTVTATVSITDAEGTPLDRLGLLTAGEVAISFVIAWLDEDANGEPLQYTAYTTRAQSSTITGASVVQAAADQNGTFEEISPGTYRYTFGTQISVADPTKTHTVAAWATRAVEDRRFVDNDELHFLPSGTGEPNTREVVTNAACNSCHGLLEAHGGARTDVQLCITCHTDQTIDPDTGNTVDFAVMVHKIHRGEDLPSVGAGRPYRIIGFRGAVHDYSDVVFPQDIRRCTTCHVGEDAERFATHPTIEACMSCHDLTSFSTQVPEGMRPHPGGPQLDDSMCSVCHPSAGGLSGVIDDHFIGLISAEAPEVALSILEVASTGPGGAPAVRFQVELDGEPTNIATATLTTLRATVAGPNTDFAEYLQATIQGRGAGGELTVLDAANGEMLYTFPDAVSLPTDASGSWTLGLEGYLQSDPEAPRFSAFSPVAPFAVTDAGPMARRTVVSNEKCDACHFELAAHGDSRKNVQYCPLCHNPNNPGDERAARLEAQSIDIDSVDFKRMIHAIHGAEMRAMPFVLGGFPAPTQEMPGGSPLDFSRVRYPRQLSDCTACHVDETYRVPLAEGVLPTIIESRTCTESTGADADQFCDDPFWTAERTLLSPATSACGGCHDSPDAQIHMELESTPAGQEACGVCHGRGSIQDVDVVHGLAEAAVAE